MFNIFKTKREKIKIEANRIFDNYIPALKGVPPDEIAFVLDFAAEIKYSTLSISEKIEQRLIFEDPMMLSQSYAFEALSVWRRHMLEEAGTLKGRAKVGALTIWYLSVVGCQIAELRVRAREMWNELERGFPYCSYFNPEHDIVKGVEPDNS